LAWVLASEPVAPAGPDWTAQTSAIATAGATAIILLTALYAARQLKDARRTRHGQLLADISRRFDEPAISESYRLYVAQTDAGIAALIDKLYGAGQKPTDKEIADYLIIARLPNLWETIGVLEREAAIPLELVDQTWGDPIRGSWDDWKPRVAQLRELCGTDKVYSNFQRLAEDLQKSKRHRRFRRDRT
jgi:hypothetical protein